MRISFAEQNHKTVNTKNRTWKGLSSTVAIAAALSASPLHAQLATDDDTVETEVVAISGQQLDGLTLGGFLPVVVGGEGDLLFLSRSANDSFITFDNALGRVTNAPAFGLQSVLRGNYSIDAAGDQFAITTRSGIVIGSVGDNIGTALSFGTSFDGVPIRDQGNLGTGSISPLVLNEQTALLVSDVGVAEADGSFIGNTQNFILFAEPGASEFGQVPAFQGRPDNASSLSFAGSDSLFASFSPLLVGANSAEASNLLRLDFDPTIDGVANQIGPNGDP